MTRTAYDDVSKELVLSSSFTVKAKKRPDRDDEDMRKKRSSAQAIKDLVDLLDRGEVSGPTLVECCSCCICIPNDRHAPKNHHEYPTREDNTTKHIRHKRVSSIETHHKHKTAYSNVKTSKKRDYKTAERKVSVISAKPRLIRSAPCLCTFFGLSDSIKHKSKIVIRRINGKNEKGEATKWVILQCLPIKDTKNKRKGLNGDKELVTESYENLKEKLKESKIQLKRRLHEENRAIKAIETGDQIKNKVKKGAKASLTTIKNLEPAVKQSIEKINKMKKRMNDIRQSQIEKLRQSRKDSLDKKKSAANVTESEIKSKMTDSAYSFECYSDECVPGESIKIMPRKKRKIQTDGLINKSSGEFRKQKIRKGLEIECKSEYLKLKQKTKASTKKDRGDKKTGTAHHKSHQTEFKSKAKLVESKTNIRLFSPKPEGTVTISDTQIICKKQHITRGSSRAIHVLKRCLCALKMKAKKSKEKVARYCRTETVQTNTSSSNLTTAQPRMQTINRHGDCYKPAYVTKLETNRKQSTKSVQCRCKPKGIQSPSRTTVECVTESSGQKQAKYSRKDRNLRHKKSQKSISTMKSKYTATKHRLQRCFSTLKLKTDKAKIEYQSTLQTSVSSRSASTQMKQEKDKNLTMSKPLKLLSNECEFLTIFKNHEGSQTNRQVKKSSTNNRRTNSTQLKSSLTQIEKKEEATRSGLALIKCFCTLKFLKKTIKKQKPSEIMTPSEETLVKDKTTPTMVTKNTTTKNTMLKLKPTDCECLERMKTKGHSKELVRSERCIHVSSTGTSRANMKSKSSIMYSSTADSESGTSRTRREQRMFPKNNKKRKYVPSTGIVKPSDESFTKKPLCQAGKIGPNYSFNLEFCKNSCQSYSKQKQKKKYTSSPKVYTVSRMPVAKSKITSQKHEADTSKFTGKTKQNESTGSMYYNEENFNLSDGKDSEPFNLQMKSSNITRKNSILNKCLCTMNINSDVNLRKVGLFGCGLLECQPLLINRMNADKTSNSEITTTPSNRVNLLSSRKERRPRPNIRLHSLKAILTRKPDSTIQHNVSNKPQKQVVRVSSTFSVDIEFSKNKKLLVTGHNNETDLKYRFDSESILKSRPNRTKARKTSNHNRNSQSITTVTENKSRASTLKRCYCKFMQNRTMKSEKNNNLNMSPSTVTTSKSERKATVATMQCSNRLESLVCNEGKHNVRIDRFQSNCRNGTCCGDVAKFKGLRSTHSVQCLFSNKQIVRIGSSYSFNIQFYKERKRHKMYSKPVKLQRKHQRKHERQCTTSRKIQYAKMGSTRACFLLNDKKLKLTNRRPSTCAFSGSSCKAAQTISSLSFKQEKSASIIFSTNYSEPSPDLTKYKSQRIAASQNCDNGTASSFIRKKVFRSNKGNFDKCVSTSPKYMYHQPNVFERSAATQIKQVYRLETKPRFLRLRSSECYPYECSRIRSSASYRARKHKSGGKKKEMKVILSPKDKSTKRGKNKSELYECEAGICAPYPGQCDPRECLKKMKKKAMQSAKIGSTQYNEQDRNNRTPYIVEAPRFKALDNPLRQTVRITSSFSLNVEFCKDILPEGLVDTKDQMCQIDCGPQMIDASVYQDIKLGHATKTKSIGTGQPNMLQRCFCTAKLHEKLTATKKTSTKETSTKKSKPLPKAKEASVGTKSKLQKHEPHLCETRTCHPYERPEMQRKPEVVETITPPPAKKCIDTQCYLDPRRCRNSKCQARPEKKTRTVALQPSRPPRPSERRGRPRRHPTLEPGEPPEEYYPNRQCVRYGSAFNFEIEFFKEKAREALKKYRPVRNEHVQYEPKRRRAVQLGSPGEDDLRHQNKSRKVSTKSMKKYYPYGHSPTVHYCGFDIKPNLTRLKSQTRNNHDCYNNIKSFPSKPTAKNTKCKKLQCDFKTKKDVEIQCLSPVICGKAGKETRPAVRIDSTISKIEFKKQVFPQRQFDSTEKKSECGRYNKFKGKSRKQKKIQEKQCDLTNRKRSKSKIVELSRSQTNIKNKTKSVDNTLERYFCTLKHHKKKTPKKIIKEITCRRAEVHHHDIQMSALYRRRTASKLKHKISENMLPLRQNAYSTNRKDNFQKIYESQPGFGEMQTIFPYISNKFNKHDSRTVVFKGKTQKRCLDRSFSPISVKTRHHSQDKKKFKRLAKEEIGNRQKPKPHQQETEGLYSNTKFIIKSFIRRVIRFFINSREKNKEDNSTKSSELYYDLRKTNAKKTRKKLKLSKTDALKTSKSDRLANHNIISTPKKTKSLKMTNELRRYKNNKDYATYQKERLNKYSKFQSGDAERNTFNVSNFYAPALSPYVNKQNNKCICTYCKCLYDRHGNKNKNLPVKYDSSLVHQTNNKLITARQDKILKTMKCHAQNESEKQTLKPCPITSEPGCHCNKGAGSLKVNKVRFKENQDVQSDSKTKRVPRATPELDLKEVALAVKKASHPSGECKDLMFQINLDPCNMSILNREEIATKVKGLKERRKSELAHLKPRQIKELHGKSCSCCICKSFKKKSVVAQGQAKVKLASDIAKKSVKKVVQKMEGKEPCICGSQVCEKEATRLANLAKTQKAIAEKKKPCICGTKICEAESFKADLKKGISKEVLLQQKKIKKVEQQKEQKKKKETEKKKRLLEKRKELEIKKKKEAIIAAKEFAQRQKMYKKQDAARRKKQKKEEKIMDKQVEKFKDTSTWVLAGESAIDVGKLAFRGVAGLFRSLGRLVIDPKRVVQQFKDAKRDPKRLFSNMKESLSDDLSPVARRVGKRMGAMICCKTAKEAMESYGWSNYMLHMLDKDPKKRIFRKKKLTRKREPVDFECSLYMASLRKKPWLWAYKKCPWFYPHCVSVASLLRSVIQLILIILAVAVWSPCLLLMETCRAMMCCTMCTG